jgi:hypothetical protein
MKADDILERIVYLVDKNFAPGEKGREDFHIQLLSSRLRELIVHIHILEEHIKQIKQTHTEH